jgi:protein required for attachment to host cells
MPKNGLNHDIWVLICDGRKALLAVNVGDAAAPNLKVRRTWEHSDPATHEQGTDRPGRTQASVGARRSATEATDYHMLAEEDFLKKLAAHLEKDVTEHKIAALILAAPPRALGVLRDALAPSVRKIVRHEVEKDYVRMPVYEIERHLTAHLNEVRSQNGV